VPEKGSEKILRQLRQEPALSAKVLAERLSLSPRAIEKQIALLKTEAASASPKVVSGRLLNEISF